MKRGMYFLVATLIALGAIFSIARPIGLRADEIDDLQKQIDELEKLKTMSEEATEPLEDELINLEGRIQSARNGIAQAKLQVAQREQDVAVQYALLSGRVAQQYKRSRIFSPLMLLFTSSSATDLTKKLAYSSSVQEQDNRMIP